MEIVQLVVNMGILGYVIISTIIQRNQNKINVNNLSMISLLNQRIRELELKESERSRKAGG